MASLFKDLTKLSAYRDRRFPGNQEDFEHALQTSTTVYIGNMSFYTTEEQVYELFSRAGEIKKIIMGLDKNSKTPCGFCFVLYYSREDTEDAVKFISGTILDDRPIRVDFDWGFQEGRQWGRGRSGGQLCVCVCARAFVVNHESNGCIIKGGGYGKLVQRELEVQRQLVDYGAGSLGSFPAVMPAPHYGRRGGGQNYGTSNRQGRVNQSSMFRGSCFLTLDKGGLISSLFLADFDSAMALMIIKNPELSHAHCILVFLNVLLFCCIIHCCLMWQEKNPRFRESTNSDDEEEDDRQQRP
ncbi:hypothetical protein D5086_014321 [Populus alba]|uniref:Uncharacterized protein n=1 Tax=Populus alba TaxID=43335 RepID=A0ACC4BXZ4_POPAL